MKKLLSPILVLLVMASCMQQNENAIMRTPANEEVVKKYLDAIVTGDTSAIDGLLADKFMDYGPGMSDSLDRAGTIADIKRNWREHWKTVKYDRYTMLSASLKDGNVPGDWVLDWGVVTVTHKDGTPDIKFQWHGVFRMENGKIAQGNAFFDQSDIMKQIGYKFIPPDTTTSSK